MDPKNILYRRFFASEQHCYHFSLCLIPFALLDRGIEMEKSKSAILFTNCLRKSR